MDMLNLSRMHDLTDLRDRVEVFEDCRHAGEVLAEMLKGAVPAGGIPIAIEIARMEPATRHDAPQAAIYCANVRGGSAFAVADAYCH